MGTGKNQLFVCNSNELGEAQHKTLGVKYKGELHSVIIFRFKHRVYAYINQCVHMPKQLTCEKDVIFDDTGKLLRCSMHGIVYDPETGISQSTMCNGEQLRSIRIIEQGGVINFCDKRISTLT